MRASGCDEAKADGGARLLLRRADRAPLGALLLVIAAIWLAPAIRGIVEGDPAIVPGLGGAGAYLAAALGAGWALIALRWLVGGRIVAIDRGTVVVSVWSLLRRQVWHEPLANYDGIRVEHEQRPHRYGARSWYVVRLGHAQSSKTVVLARAKDPALIARRARDYAARLGLPLSWREGEPREWRIREQGSRSADAARAGEPLGAR